MVSAHFQFRFVGTNSKEGDKSKGSNYLLQFGAWDVPIEDEIGEVSSEGFRKERQMDNAVQTAVMWDSILCVTRLPPNYAPLHYLNSWIQEAGKIPINGRWYEQEQRSQIVPQSLKM